MTVTPAPTRKGITINDLRINERIRVSEVRLVGPAGEQVGVVRIEDALRLAQESDLDLVEVSPESKPPVCKLMDYGKFKYENAQKDREARRNQANTVLKEIRFRLKIDEHDYETKKGHVLRFLNAGDKVKVTIMFRGREQSRPEMGMRLLHKLAEEVAEYAVIENAPTREGRNMSLVLGPLKRKAEVIDEARKTREQLKTEKKQAKIEKSQAKARAQAEVEANKANKAAAKVAPAAAPAPAAPAAEKAAPAPKAPAAKAPAAKAPAAKAAPKAAAPKAAAPKAAAPKAAPKAAAPKKAAPKKAAPAKKTSDD